MVYLMCACVCFLLLSMSLEARHLPCGFKTMLWDQIKGLFSALKDQNNRTFLRSTKKYELIVNVLSVSALRKCFLMRPRRTHRNISDFVASFVGALVIVVFVVVFNFEIVLPPVQMSCHSSPLPPGFSHSVHQALNLCTWRLFCCECVFFLLFPCAHRFGYLLPCRVAECRKH